MNNRFSCDPMPESVILDNLSVDVVCELVLSGSFDYVRVATNLLNIFYVSLIPEDFASQLKFSCTGERFTCTIVPWNGKKILYVDETLKGQSIPF